MGDNLDANDNNNNGVPEIDIFEGLLALDDGGEPFGPFQAAWELLPVPDDQLGENLEANNNNNNNAVPDPEDIIGMGENLEAHNNNNNNNGVPDPNPDPDLEDVRYREWINGGKSFQVGSEPLKLPDELGKPIDGTTAPRFPPVEALQGLIGKCGSPFEKQLTDTDVKRDQGRCSIINELFQQFVKPLLKAAENKILKNPKKGIDVTVYDSKGKEFLMKFKKWCKYPVLTSGWTDFSQDKKFKALRDWVTIWVFRHKETDKLCFVMIARRFRITELVAKRAQQKKRKAEEDPEVDR